MQAHEGKAIIGLNHISAFFAGCVFGFILLAFYLMKAMNMYPAENGQILAKKKYIINKDGVREISEMSESHTKWTGIIRVVETPEYFYLFQDTCMACFIPRDQVDANELGNELKQYCSNYHVIAK